MATRNQAVLDKLIQILQNDLPAKVTAQGLTAPSDFRIGHPEETAVPIARTPLISIEPLEGIVQSRTIGSQQMRESEMPVDIWIWAGGRTPSDVVKELAGYVDCIDEVLSADATLGGTAQIASTRELAFSPRIEIEGGLLQVCAVTIRVKTSYRRGD